MRAVSLRCSGSGGVALVDGATKSGKQHLANRATAANRKQSPHCEKPLALENSKMANEQIKSLLYAGYFGAAVFELEEAAMPCPILSTGEEPWLLFRFKSTAERAVPWHGRRGLEYPSGATWQLGPAGDVHIPAEDMPAYTNS